jgi:hypothetical protein
MEVSSWGVLVALPTDMPGMFFFYQTTSECRDQEAESVTPTCTPDDGQLGRNM